MRWPTTEKSNDKDKMNVLSELRFDDPAGVFISALDSEIT